MIHTHMTIMLDQVNTNNAVPQAGYQ